MLHETLFHPITVDQFLAIRFPDDRKFELVDGAIRMMTGGTIAHARIASNINAFLRNALRGSGCRPYGSDMAIRITDVTLRYPDVSIYCGPQNADADTQLYFSDPRVVIEVLSPSTASEDQHEKLEQYRTLASVDTIVFVHPTTQLSRVVQRLGPTSWRDDLFAQPHAVHLPSVGVTLPHDEIFARD